MFRLFIKILVFPLLLVLLLMKALIKIFIELSSIILGSLMLFTFGCIIFTIYKQNWSQTFLLSLIEAGFMFVTIFTAIAEGFLDTVLNKIAKI